MRLTIGTVAEVSGAAKGKETSLHFIVGTSESLTQGHGGGLGLQREASYNNQILIKIKLLN